MERLGSRIRAKREQLSLHLVDLAEKVGVSPSLISQIEKGKAFPSILTLKKIANELSTTVGELIGENESVSTEPVVKKEERGFIREPVKGVKLYLVSPYSQNKNMETIYIELGSGKEFNLRSDKHSQEFLFVIKGNIIVEMKDKSYNMEEGDSVYCFSNIEHKIINNSNEGAELLWIISPPY